MQTRNHIDAIWLTTQWARRTVTSAVLVAMIAAMLALAAGPVRAAATTLVVQQGGSCLDTGPGTTSTPFCTISAAAAKAIAGDTVKVGAGTYREQVTVPSGVTFRATTTNAVVLGTDDFTGASWTATGAGTWSTTVPGAVTPSRVFLGGSVLTEVTGPPTTVDTWSWDPGTRVLSVSTGGSAPAGIDVTTRQYGFVLGSPTTGITGATVEGFTLGRQGGAGVFLRSGTSGARIQGVTVTESASYGIRDDDGSGNTVTGVHTYANASVGIRLSNTTGDLVASSTSDGNGFHGISVQGGTGNTVRAVVASANKKPGTRVAAGIDVSQGSVAAVVEASVAYGNDDSGIEIYTGSSGAVVRRNITYSNGDHGIDISRAPNSTVISNTVVDNQTSGINVEGLSTGATLRNNIAADNTQDGSRSVGDIRVESGSEPGTTLDRDIVSESSGAGVVVEWQGVNYTSATFATFRSTSGQEATGLAADPRFVGRATHDLRLQGSSPAIDRADTTAAGWRAADQEGRGPVDDPKVANFGAGTTADLGALEFHGAVAMAPIADPASTDGLSYMVDASNSGTLGETTTAFTVDCGTGTGAVNGTAHVRCTYPADGTYTIRVSVTGASVRGSSYSDTATIPITARENPVPTPVLRLSASRVRQGGTVWADASSSTDAASYRFDCGRGLGAAQSTPRYPCGYWTTGTYTVTVVVASSNGITATTSQTVTVVAGLAPTARLKLSRHHVRRGQRVRASARHSYGGPGTLIRAFKFSCGNGKRSKWITSSRIVCRYHNAGRHKIRVRVLNSIGLVDIATRIVHVRR